MNHANAIPLLALRPCHLVPRSDAAAARLEAAPRRQQPASHKGRIRARRAYAAELGSYGPTRRASRCRKAGIGPGSPAASMLAVAIWELAVSSTARQPGRAAPVRYQGSPAAALVQAAVRPASEIRQ